ncbi:MAG TPA: signal peptidase II [Chloroflexia bacterium]|nr:signal peptidase II [Chloroflexia bacterium]
MNKSILGIIALVLVAGLVVAIDQATKAWIAANIVSHEVRPVIEGFVRLRYTQNTGAAFGIFQGGAGVLSLAGLVVLSIILLVAFRVGRSNPLILLALSLISGGAIGNLIDRLRLGYVVDFVDVHGPSITFDNRVYTWPVFNVADSAISMGVVLLMAFFLFGKQETAPPGPVPPETSIRYISHSHSPWFTQHDRRPDAHAGHEPGNG